MDYLNFLLAFVAFGCVTGCDYSQFGNEHTMCKYKENACNANPRGFSQSEAAEMVKLHNEKRQKVASGQEPGQPSASNMKKMVWDQELASIAQRWADQCTFNHDKNRKSKKYPQSVGQNVYISWSSSPDTKLDVASAVNSWYNEVTKPGFNARDINPFKFNGGAGHYTQVVWATTEAVGCGFSFYKDKGMNTKLVVCNYGPGGNMMGGVMYKTGRQCSECANGCSRDYNALCN